MKFMGNSMPLKCPGPMTAEKPQSSLCWCALFVFCALWSDIFTLVPRCTVWPSDEGWRFTPGNVSSCFPVVHCRLHCEYFKHLEILLTPSTGVYLAAVLVTCSESPRSEVERRGVVGLLSC